MKFTTNKAIEFAQANPNRWFDASELQEYCAAQGCITSIPNMTRALFNLDKMGLIEKRQKGHSKEYKLK
jgi:hypothetical protein